MRDRYYAFLTRGESLKGDGARYTDMLPVNATYELVNDQFVHFDIKLEDSWLLPSFLDDMQMDNSTVLSPAIEILCVDLYYPHASMSAATALPMRAVGENSVYFSTSLATFGGVQPVSTSYGVNVKRVLAGGFANTGDLDSDGTHGSMYAQMDLPVRPGKTLPSGTRFEFSAPSVFISNEFADAFTSIDSTLKCYFGATYTNPSAAVEHLTMRDRYYKSLNNTGTLAGNGVSFTDMSSDTYSSTSMLSSKIRFSVTLNNPWVVPAFLADSFIKDDVALTPVVELLCVRLRYPHVKMDIAQDLTFRASYTGATFFTSYTGTFSGLELKPREVLKPLWFEHVTESSEPYYVGRWGVTVHDYSFDIVARIRVQARDWRCAAVCAHRGILPAHAMHCQRCCCVRADVAHVHALRGPDGRDCCIRHGSQGPRRQGIDQPAGYTFARQRHHVRPRSARAHACADHHPQG
jgi:hypothetical protein